MYTVGDLGEHVAAYEAPQQPVAVHRLPSKMSSIAWSPDSEVRSGLFVVVIKFVNPFVIVLFMLDYRCIKHVCLMRACVPLCAACI